MELEEFVFGRCEIDVQTVNGAQEDCPSKSTRGTTADTMVNCAAILSNRSADGELPCSGSGDPSRSGRAGGIVRPNQYDSDHER